MTDPEHRCHAFTPPSGRSLGRVRRGAGWSALAARETRLQIDAWSFGSVMEHVNPWDFEAFSAPPVRDADAVAAEDAWARFGAAAEDIAGVFKMLEAFIAG